MTPLAAGVHVGCCGWPVRREEYARRLGAVEVQQTFYQPPAVETARRWREVAPAGFVFCVKAWQLVTHPAGSPTYRRLRSPLAPEERPLCGLLRPTAPVRRGWEATLAVARALGAAVVLLQTPPAFDPRPEHLANLRALIPELRAGGIPLAWEPRGGWPPEQFLRLCDELGLIPAGDPLGPLGAALARGPVRYFRLHGRGGFHYRYSDADLDLSSTADRAVGHLVRAISPGPQGFLGGEGGKTPKLHRHTLVGREIDNQA